MLPPRSLIDETNVSSMSADCYRERVDFRRPLEAMIPDAQGRILSTLARTTQELNLRTLAELSGVSLAHVARIVPRLAELGVIERRDVPPAVLVRLVREHLATRPLLALADLRHALLEELRESACQLHPKPTNVTLFGSFARGDDDLHSDIDLMVVRPRAVADDDSSWAESLDTWEAHLHRVSGNPVNRIEVAEDDVPKLLRSHRPLWQAVRREGSVILGAPLSAIEAAAHA
jgi:predicted nucleotidyltransferase